MVNVACYCRVSTSAQEDGYSIPEQQERMKKYCDAMGWNVYKVYIDAGYTGSNKEGLYHGGGYIPIGYDYIDGQLIINEYEAMQIREIHQLFQKGKSYREIERIMNDKGYTHKHGKWYHKSIKGVLTNNLYLGKIKWLENDYAGSHAPIIDNETFEKTQIELKARNNRPNHFQRTTLLGGLLFCRNCGARYGVTRQHANGKRYRYYTCYSRSKAQQSMIKDRNCKNKTWNMQELDEIVLGEIQKLATDDTAIKNIVKNSNDEKRNILEDEIKKIDTQKSRFMDLYGIGTFTIDELNNKIIPLDERKKKLEQELKNTPNGMSEKETIETLATFEDVIISGDFERIRLLINALIDKIELDNEDVYIYWRFI